MSRKRLYHVPLTPETLAAAYDYLLTTPPFNKWSFPDSEDVKFIVISHAEDWGRYTCSGHGKKKIHYVSVSSKRVAYTETLMATMAHELLHMHQWATKQSTPRVMHNDAFKCDAEIICRIHGFDPKAFL